MSTRNHPIVRGLAIALLLTASGCELDPEPGDPECPSNPAQVGPDAPVTGTITSVAISGVPYEGKILSSGTLTITGEATQRNGLAIRHVFVGAVEADQDEFNFRSWKAELSFAALASLLEPGSDDVVVEVVARDACGDESLIDQLVVALDRTPGIQVDSLALTLGDAANPTTQLPADGSAATLVTVSANPSAAGATVMVAASSGTIEGLGAGGALLSGNGVDPARATVLYRGSEPGPVLITATGEGQLATALLDVVGAPRLVPAAATLVEGERLVVSVDSEAVLDYCQASPRFGVVVSAFGEDLMGGPVNPPGGVFEVIAEGPLDDVVQVTVSCFDVFGQFVKGTYTAEPGPEPVEEPAAEEPAAEDPP